jgi:hypothetical protein
VLETTTPGLGYLTRGIGSAETEKLRAAPDVWYATHLEAVYEEAGGHGIRGDQHAND